MILKKLNLIILGLGLVLMTSCKEEEKTPEATPQPTEANATTNQNEDAPKLNPAHGMPGHDCAIPVGAPLNGTAANTTTPANTTQSTVSPIRVDQTPNVNPPHGEPGHDCTVPVGSPLNQ